MTISTRDWIRYITKLRAISDKAAGMMQDYVDKVGFENSSSIIHYAYALSTKYGEAAAEAACEMYDAVSAAAKAAVPAAEPAATATYGEITKAVNGAIKDSCEGQIPQIVGRKVKQAGADTTLKNAIRDGAEFAWVPHGDTCAFCITLTSRGWQRASEKALKGGHAEHIHSNCDCEYAIRFGDNDGVRGYDPDYYKRIYYGHDGDINSIRREQYQKNKEKINAQKREAYARKHRFIEEKERLHTSYSNRVQMSVLDAPGYMEKFKGITGIEEVDNAIYKSTKEILEHRDGTDYEDLHLIDAKTGEVLHKLTTCNESHGVSYDKETLAAIEKAHSEGRSIIAIHNHPGGLPPTMDDGVSIYDHRYTKGVAVGHNMEVYTYGSTDQHYSKEQCAEVHDTIKRAVMFSIDFEDDVWYNYLKLYGMEVIRK